MIWPYLEACLLWACCCVGTRLTSSQSSTSSSDMQAEHADCFRDGLLACSHDRQEGHSDGRITSEALAGSPPVALIHAAIDLDIAHAGPLCAPRTLQVLRQPPHHIPAQQQCTHLEPNGGM